jgi:signal transduction histidine kinase
MRFMPSLRSVRPLLRRVRLPWTDIAMAVFLAIVGIVWVTHAHQNDWTAMNVPLPKVPDLPIPPSAPAAPAPDPYAFLLHSHDDTGRAVAVNVFAALPLAIRRKLPYAAFVIGFTVVLAVHDGLVLPGFVAIVILAYSMVAHGRHLWASLALLAITATITASVFSTSIPSMPGWLSPFAILAPIGLAAATIRNARARADASARRALALEHEQEAVARAAIAEERARIARELHDVVSHHVSVMVIQASAAGKVIGTRPDLAAEALRSIENSGREAMGELRHLLGLVAPLDDQWHPQPGLGELDALVGAVRAAGQPVTIHHDAGDVPKSVDLTAYRVIQEGLTNAIRYAPGAVTDIVLRRDREMLVVEVRNGRPTVPGGAVAGGGSGLVGLTERLRLHHGTLEWGPRVSGGFRLVARIPIAESPLDDSPVVENPVADVVVA